MKHTIEQRLNHLKDYCNTVMLANLVNKHGFHLRDMYPYKSGEQPKEDIRKGKFGMYDNNLPRPLIGQTSWGCYLTDNIIGYQIHNLQILKNTYQPQITFDDYLNSRITWQ